MEDDYFISKDGRFAGVYDGHGGAAVSKYLKQNLQAQVRGELNVHRVVVVAVCLFVCVCVEGRGLYICMY